MQGKIVKGIAGFYYVHVAGHGVYECKAKGVFRKNNEKPLVGDMCIIEVLDEENKIGNISSICDRKNSLIRPNVANVDQALVIFASIKPAPNYNLLDRFLILMQQHDIPCVLVFNKRDLADDKLLAEIEEVYEKVGYPIIFASAKEGEGVDEIKALLKGKTTTVAGPSGVGKSSLINLFQDEVEMETGVLSEKIDRGKHTTRHSELIALENGSYILDTPGFSSLGLFDIEKEDLKDYYSEFEKYSEGCKFDNCVHMNEPVCGVKAAVEDGNISKVRYENYRMLYTELEQKRQY